MALRFAHVLIYPPTQFLFSDPMRHWMNGERFFRPDLMGSVDPLMYQLWVMALRGLTADDPLRVAVVTGLLCACLPWLWYRALAEILPKNAALGWGALIGVLPSLIMPYSYFMTETLLLPLIAGAVWASFASARKRSAWGWALAAGLWALASFTRSAALPVAACVLGWLWLREREGRVARAVIALGVFALLFLPACWHSSLTLRYCAPLGATEMNTIYRASGAARFSVDVLGVGRWGFSSPSMYSKPLSPLSEWTPPREGDFNFTIDPRRGRADWRAAIDRAKAQSTLPFAEDFEENALLYFFGASWPDNNHEIPMGWLAVQSRWLWFPLTLAVVGMLATRWRRVGWEERIIPVAAVLLTVLMLTQRQGVMEGRYRKPVEPLLVASLALLSPRRRVEPRNLHVERERET